MTGPVEQIEAVIDASLVPLLLEITRTSEFGSAHKDALWALRNAAFCGTSEQIRYLVGVLQCLRDALELTDDAEMTPTLDGIENILKVGHMPRGGGRSAGCPRTGTRASWTWRRAAARAA